MILNRIKTLWAEGKPAIRQRDPVADRLRGRFELAGGGKVKRITTGAHEFDHLTTKLRRVWRACLGICEASCEA